MWKINKFKKNFVLEDFFNFILFFIFVANSSAQHVLLQACKGCKSFIGEMNIGKFDIWQFSQANETDSQ